MALTHTVCGWAFVVLCAGWYLAGPGLLQTVVFFKHISFIEPEYWIVKAMQRTYCCHVHRFLSSYSCVLFCKAKSMGEPI